MLNPKSLVADHILSPAYWQGSEITISLFCICLPSISFLIKRCVREGFSSLFTLSSVTAQRRLRGRHNDVLAETAFPPRSKLIKLENSEGLDQTGSNGGEV